MLSRLLVAASVATVCVLGENGVPAPDVDVPAPSPKTTTTPPHTHQPYVTANHHPPTDWLSIKGAVEGNFEFLGALCFGADDSKKTITRLDLSFTIPKEAPADLRVLFYDDQPDSFDMITREPPSIYNENSCYSKSLASKSFKKCHPGQQCDHGLTFRSMNSQYLGAGNWECGSYQDQGCWKYTLPVQVAETTKRIWYFVAAQCDYGHVEIINYNIKSDEAIDCELVRLMYQIERQPANTWGYTLVITILIGGVMVTYIFLVRFFYAGSQADYSDASESLDPDDDNAILDEDSKDYNAL